MKKAIAALALSLFVTAGVFAGNIKEASVPVVVKDYIAKTYPRVGPVEWDYDEKANLYTAQFSVNGENYKVDVAPTGEMVNADMQIKSNLLPAAAQKYIGEQFPGFTVKDAHKIIRRGVVNYEVEVNGNNSDQMLYFSENGTILKRKS